MKEQHKIDRRQDGMIVEIEYNRERALEYAERWALERNPLFENYSGIGGDCTSFVSQAIYASSCVMNYTPTFGWYYISPTDRAPAWSGVEYLYNFLTSNAADGGVGPYASETYPGGLDLGDVIQLGNQRGAWYHSLVVTGYTDDGYLVSAHSDDALNRPLSTYDYYMARFLHIRGVRLEIPDSFLPMCFEGLINGKSL